MSSNTVRTGGRASWPAGAKPALLVLALGIGVVLLRPALPVDETRYLEVFHESLRGSPLLLRLLGEPYSEKPPLLFWLGRILTWLAVPPDTALRLVPGIASALTVLLAERIGRRAGLRLVGWVQASLCLASFAGQFLLFDTLLSVAVWGAVDAWVRRKDIGLTLWSAAALLAKGPVALLFLIPFLWSTAPLRNPGTGNVRRAALALLLALAPLAAWALSAAAVGGEAFANALLWERWAGRVVRAADHPRPFLFYVPVVLLGALPATFVLIDFLWRGALDVPGWAVRLTRTLVFLFVAFTLISGKQAHYLVPAAPALALLLARALERDSAVRRLRWGIGLQLGLLLAVSLVAIVRLPGHLESFGPLGRELVTRGTHRLPLALSAAAALIGLLGVTRRPHAPGRLLILCAVGALGAALPLHWLAGRLLYPHALAQALRAPHGEVAFLGTSHHGAYAWLCGTSRLEKLHPSELSAWIRAHPEGLVLVDPDALDGDLPDDVATVARDVLHRSVVLVVRRAEH